jgi:FixJ family two-component response regulator
VFVVDPDPSTGQITRELCGGLGVSSVVFRTGHEFLVAYHDTKSGCLVLELRIPDLNGLQLQGRLAKSGCALPLVFVMAKPDVSTAVELMRRGAVHVLEKPLQAAELLEAIHQALDLDRERRSTSGQVSKLNKLAVALTRKELEVVKLIARGKSPKAIAIELKLSVRAVELRRSSLMAKLNVGSSLELMRFAVAHLELG